MNNEKRPKFMTINEFAKLGILSAHVLRRMEKAKELPCIYTGNRCLINADMLIEQLNNLGNRNHEN